MLTSVLPRQAPHWLTSSMLPSPWPPSGLLHHLQTNHLPYILVYFVPKPCRGSTLAATWSRSSSLQDLSFLICKMGTKGLPPGVVRGDTAWEDANHCKEGCQVITQ